MALTMATLTHKVKFAHPGNEIPVYQEDARIAVVCDSMGGHNGGNVASGLAVEVVANGLMELRPEDWHDEDTIVKQ